MNTRQFIKTSALASLGLITPGFVGNKKDFSRIIDGKDLLKFKPQSGNKCQTLYMPAVSRFDEKTCGLSGVVIEIADNSFQDNELVVRTFDKKSLNHNNLEINSIATIHKISKLNLKSVDVYNFNYGRIALVLDIDDKVNLEVSFYWDIQSYPQSLVINTFPA